MDGLFPTIFHGERSELREKYGLARRLHERAMFGLASASMHLQIPKRSVGIWSLLFEWARWVPLKL
jgi:hypothetical protein